MLARGVCGQNGELRAQKAKLQMDRWVFDDVFRRDGSAGLWVCFGQLSSCDHVSPDGVEGGVLDGDGGR